jgi:hypothetical protein
MKVGRRIFAAVQAARPSLGGEVAEQPSET